MMYIVFIIDHIHHLMNESKMLVFAYNSDRRVYKLKTCIYSKCKETWILFSWIKNMFKSSQEIIVYLLSVCLNLQDWQSELDPNQQDSQFALFHMNRSIQTC